MRVNSDIMIQMNKSDGFNTSIREALYADNILISAVWLPYSLLRLENIFFYETDFAKLGETVTFVLNNYEKIKDNLTDNPNKAKKLTAFSQNFQPWIRIFDIFELNIRFIFKINLNLDNMEYQICKNCVMDTSDPEITFDENGVCNYCRSYEEEKNFYNKRRGET